MIAGALRAARHSRPTLRQAVPMLQAECEGVRKFLCLSNRQRSPAGSVSACSSPSSS